MSKIIRIEIHTGNAAFDGDPGVEVARTLRGIADEFESMGTAYRTLRDINGNKVGTAEVVTPLSDAETAEQAQYRQYAIGTLTTPELEFDEEAEVSVDDEEKNGAWVRAWVWVNKWKLGGVT